MTLVRARRLSKRYTGDVRALADVSLDIRGGEMVLIMGPSGSGKTTLLCILAGLLRTDEGDVELCGHRLTELPPSATARVRRQHLGFVLQGYNLFGALTALDNVAEPLAMKGMGIAAARCKASEYLERVGLGERAHHRPADLSGGEKQRVAVARALAGEPDLVFGDEPTASLDGKTAASVVQLLRAAVDERRSVVVVTHDLRLAPYADRIVHLEDGRVTRDETS